MRTNGATLIGAGTDPGLLEVAGWRAQFEVSRALSRGEEPGGVRTCVIEKFRADIAAESFGEWADETLMAALQRGVEVALTRQSTA